MRPCSARARRSSRPTSPTRCGPRRSTGSCRAGERGSALADPGALARCCPRSRRRTGAGDRHRTHRALRDLLERLAAARAAGRLDGRRALGRSGVGRRAGGARAPAARRAGAVRARRARGPAARRAGARARRRAPRGPRHRAAAGAAERGRGGRARRRGGRGDLPADRRQPVLPRAARARAAARRRSPPRAQRRARCRRRSRPRWPPSWPRWRRSARRVLDAAAVAGDPFEPEPGRRRGRAARAGGAARARRAARSGRSSGRPAAPRRFAFRHPVVRHAVYVATPAAWRLGAHARAAAALERRGAGPVQRAHHVEHAARPGDEDAIALLSAAADELQAPAPATAARFHAAALRLLPDHPAQQARRSRLQRLLADAQAAAGDPPAARETLLDALQTARARRAAGAHGRAGQPGVVARRPRGRAAAGCRSRSASCRRSRRRTASACGSRSADRAAGAATSTRRRPRPATRATTPARSAIPCSSSPRSPRRARERLGGRRARRRRAASRSPPPRSSGSPRPQLATRLPRSGCTAARAARSGSSRRRSPTSGAAPRSPSRPAASASC